MRKLSLCLVAIVLLLMVPSAAQAKHHPMLFQTMSAGDVTVFAPGETAEFHYFVQLYWCSWAATEADCTLMIVQRKGWRSPLETITSVPLGMRPILRVRDVCNLPPSCANVDAWQVDLPPGGYEWYVSATIAGPRGPLTNSMHDLGVLIVER